jgi:hypothetical protein
MPAASTVLKDSQPADSSTRGSHDGAVPSGFILKLFQMVNGAPDDMITVSLLSRSMDEPSCFSIRENGPAGKRLSHLGVFLLHYGLCE